MYPGLESYNPINESELDGIYQQTTSMLYSRDYQCAVKNDFRNERLLLEAKKSKKKSKKEATYAETSLSLGFHWNYVFYKRLQFNVLDFIECSNRKDKNANTITYRQVSDVGKLRANQNIQVITKQAKEILDSLITIRKKTKMYYKEKKPTAYEFWEDEKESTSILLQKQISDYINGGYVQSLAELKKGTIPQKYADGIEFYLNYLLHINNLPISDDDIEKASKHHSCAMDSLMDYSIGILFDVMKLLAYLMYNPINGILKDDKEYCYSYYITDIQSFSRILMNRFYQQFPKLGEPVFTSLVSAVVTNAVFCIFSPYIEDYLLTLHETNDRDFATSIKEIKEKAPNCFGLATELFDDSQACLQQVITEIQEASTCVSPLYRIRTYSNNMKTLYSYLYNKYNEQKKTIEPTELMDMAAKFVILMAPEHFLASSTYLTIYKQCIPAGMIDENTIAFLGRAYNMLKSLMV